MLFLRGMVPVKVVKLTTSVFHSMTLRGNELLILRIWQLMPLSSDLLSVLWQAGRRVKVYIFLCGMVHAKVMELAILPSANL